MSFAGFTTHLREFASPNVSQSNKFSYNKKMNIYNRYLSNAKDLLNHQSNHFIMMGITIFLICNISSSVEIKKIEIVDSPVLTVVEAAEKISFSPLINDKNTDRFKKIANFDLPESIKTNNISKHITKVQLEKKEYFLALASQAEGFRSNIYKDNEGWAIGNGWNLTKQSPQYNRALAQAVFSDKETVDTLTHMSSKSSKPVTMAQMKAVEIKPQKALQVTYLIGEKIKKEYVIPGISQVIQKNQKVEELVADKIAQKVFNNLKKNEQDTLIYHAYKCGGYSFLKFNNLITKVVDYSLKIKPVTKESIIAEFNYSYKLDGKKILDKQAQELVGSMFLGPQHFAQVTNIKTMSFDVKNDTKSIKTAASTPLKVTKPISGKAVTKKITEIRLAKKTSKEIKLVSANIKKNRV